MTPDNSTMPGLQNFSLYVMQQGLLQECSSNFRNRCTSYNRRSYSPMYRRPFNNSRRFSQKRIPNQKCCLKGDALVVASLHRLITDHRSPITDHRSPITDHRSPITDHRSPITDYRSPITDHRSPITDYLFLPPSLIII
jgi:hypothetical protein